MTADPTTTEQANQSFLNLLGIDTTKRTVLSVTLKLRSQQFPLLVVHELAPNPTHPNIHKRFRLVPDGAASAYPLMPVASIAFRPF